MSSMKEFMQTFAVNQALKYIEGDPNENLPKLRCFLLWDTPAVLSNDFFTQEEYNYSI